MNDIEGMIRTYIAENMLFTGDGYPYADDTSFLEEGVVDSTGVLELVMFVEENFEITVKDEDLLPDNFDSVSRLAAYVRAQVSVAAGEV